MNFCSNCGTQLNSDNQQFCNNCGAKLRSDSTSQSQYTTTSQTNYTQQQVGQNQFYEAQNTNVVYSMKWFKFLINFALFAGAVINLVYGINYMSGNIYFIQTNGQATAEIVYSVFSGLKSIDILYGVAMIAIGGFSIFTRFRLSQYKKDGPMFLYILYGVSAGLSLFYSIAVAIVSGVNQVWIGVAMMIIIVVIIVPNVKYFTKRNELFVN